MRVQNTNRSTHGFTLVEALVVVAIIAVLAAIAVPVSISFKNRAYRHQAVTKLRALGTAFVSYTSDNNGMLPWEDAPGPDDWQNVSDPVNTEVWYNALPEMMNSKPLSALVSNPGQFYSDEYPLYLPGAPYPRSDKKLGKPKFAIAMNSRLQRKDDDGVKHRGTLASIQAPERTVVFLERGMKRDKKTNPGQTGFDGSPKANPRAFVARYNGKGLLIFVDGHVGMFAVSDLIGTSGLIKMPQLDVVWTPDPEDDPN